MNELKMRRLLMNKTCEQVAKEIGISNVSLANYENKKTVPGFRTACKLSDYYQIPLEDLRSFFAT